VEESGIMQEFERTAERLLEDADKTARRTGKDTNGYNRCLVKHWKMNVKW